MCFSPQVSFLAAGVLGALGVACLAQAPQLREKPMAAIPLMFAAQQALEGFIWLSPLHDGRISNACVMGYLGFAKVVWPTYAPLAVLLLEPSAVRRRIMAVCTAIGVMISTYLAWGLATYPQWAELRRGHISYVNEQGIPLWVGVLYLGAVCLSLLASSQPAIVAFGLIVFAGAAIVRLGAAYAFPSLWCFFAAIASSVLLFHFLREKRRRDPGSGSPEEDAAPRDRLVPDVG
jgi:hypothetical protein